MSDADIAYQAAQEAISRAKRERATSLDFAFGDKLLPSLHALPPEIAELTSLEEFCIMGTRVSKLAPIRELTALRVLRLDSTPVTDLLPLKALTGLEALYLEETKIVDLTPLSSLSKLRSLGLNNTQIDDLTPIRNLISLTYLGLAGTRIRDLSPIQALTNLKGLELDGTKHLTDLRPIKNLHALTELHYGGCAACDVDPDGLGKLWGIGDNKERTDETLAYLRSLAAWPPVPVEAPAQDDVLKVARNDEGKLDTVPARPCLEEVAEPLKPALYSRLQAAFDELASATGNQQPDVSRRARVAQTHFAEDFSQADMIALYLDVAWAQGQLDRRGERQGDERFTPAAVAALNEIIAIGPGLVLDNPEVEKLEERRRRFADARVAPEVVTAQASLATTIAAELRLFGEQLRTYAALTQLGGCDLGSRGQVVQNSLGKNTIVMAGMLIVAEAVAVAVVEPLVGPPATAFAEWLLANASTIRAAASGWGGMFLAWLDLILEQASAIAAAAHSAGAIRPAPLSGRPR